MSGRGPGVVIVMLLIVSVIGIAAMLNMPEPPEQDAGVVTEDMPEWDCSTDGNGICGPVSVVILEDGAAVVVNNEGEPIAVAKADHVSDTRTENFG